MADKKQINPKKPIPASGYDRLRDNLSSNFSDGFPVENFPNPDNRANINRGTITSRKDDTVQDVSIGLQDHDEAIMYYFNNVIKPSVIINENRTKVPLIYGSPERWKGVQKDGYYRDKEGKIQTPLIMFKRDSVDKRRDLGKKLDANNPQLYYTFQEKYTKKNQYDNFSVLMNRKPIKEYHATVIPDYVDINYSCIIWTDYVAQMNKLIEMINYASDSYWGDPERFKFNAKIDTYNSTTELAQGSNRSVKTTFGLKISGYLVPDSLNKELLKQPPKKFSKAVISFGVETESVPQEKQKTRKTVREATGIQNIQQSGVGVGYSTVMGKGSAVGGLPPSSSTAISLLYDYQVGTGYTVTPGESWINGIFGRRFIQWLDQSGTDRHLLPEDGSWRLPLYNYPTYDSQRPILGGSQIGSMGVDYPSSNDGFIFDANSTNFYCKSTLFNTPINDLEEYTFFMCLYLGSDVSSSINAETHHTGKWNPLISGITTFSGSGAELTHQSIIMYEADTTLAQNLEVGNQQLRLKGDGTNNQGVIVPISVSDRPAPSEKHILTVSVSGSGEIKVRKNGVQIFTTGSSALSGSSYTFNTMGSTHVQFEGVPPLGDAGYSNSTNLDGVIFESSMADSWMTDTDIYAMEQVIATRNGLSI